MDRYAWPGRWCDTVANLGDTLQTHLQLGAHRPIGGGIAAAQVAMIRELEEADACLGQRLMQFALRNKAQAHQLRRRYLAAPEDAHENAGNFLRGA